MRIRSFLVGTAAVASIGFTLSPPSPTVAVEERPVENVMYVEPYKSMAGCERGRDKYLAGKPGRKAGSCHFNGWIGGVKTFMFKMY